MITTIHVDNNTKTDAILFAKTFDLLKLPNAQIIPLFGANGAGKSTLIRAIRDSLQAPAKHRAAVQKYQKTWEIEDVEKEMQSGTWKGNVIRKELERIDALDTLEFEYDEESLCGGIAVPKKPIALYSYCNSQDNLRRGSHDKLENVDRFISFFESQHLSEGQTIMYSLKDFINGLISDKEAHKENQNILLLMDEFDSGLSIENVIYLCRRMKVLAHKWRDMQIIFAFNNPAVLTVFPDVISVYTGEVLHIETMPKMLAEIKKHEKELKKARQTSRGKYKTFLDE